jgi:hypothetical protein
MGFRLGELKATHAEKLFYERFDLLFQERL